MSLILKGIDLPTDENKPLIVEIWASGTVWEEIEGDYMCMENSAIQIPKDHGTLKDVDKIDYDEFWHREGQGFTIAVCQGAQRIIEEQPTILEAEE